MSSDNLHPADFLAELASAIKAVRDRGGKWNKTADTIQWANDRIVRLESKLDTLTADLKESEAHCKALFDNLELATTKLHGEEAIRNAALERAAAAESRLDSMTQMWKHDNELGQELASRLEALTKERELICKLVNTEADAWLRTSLQQVVGVRVVEKQTPFEGRAPGPRELGGKPGYLVDKRGNE